MNVSTYTTYISGDTNSFKRLKIIRPCSWSRETIWPLKKIFLDMSKNTFSKVRISRRFNAGVLKMARCSNNNFRRKLFESLCSYSYDFKNEFHHFRNLCWRRRPSASEAGRHLATNAHSVDPDSHLWFKPSSRLPHINNQNMSIFLGADFQVLAEGARNFSKSQPWNRFVIRRPKCKVTLFWSMSIFFSGTESVWLQCGAR